MTLKAMFMKIGRADSDRRTSNVTLLFHKNTLNMLNGQCWITATMKHVEETCIVTDDYMTELKCKLCICCDFVTLNCLDTSNNHDCV